MPKPEDAPRKLSPQEQLAILRKELENLSKQMRKYSLLRLSQESYAQLYLRQQQVLSDIEEVIKSIPSAGPSPVTNDFFGTHDPQGRRPWRRPRRRGR